MNTRRAIVTGAYGAIGTAITEGIAAEGYHTTLVGRNTASLRKTAEYIKGVSANPNVDYYTVDLSEKKSVESFASQWRGPLHILINNAAATPRQRLENSQGIEMQFATNVLGYVWMIENLYPFMKDQPDARIVNVASYWAGDLDLSDLEFTRRYYDNDTAYRQSKQADRMLTAAYAQKLATHNIAVLAAHPGDVSSKLSNNLGYGGWESPLKGAETPLFCALHPGLKGVTGKYFQNKNETPCHFAADQQAVQQLWDICQSY